jgi:YD repeat-containing protein
MYLNGQRIHDQVCAGGQPCQYSQDLNKCTLATSNTVVVTEACTDSACQTRTDEASVSFPRVVADPTVTVSFIPTPVADEEIHVTYTFPDTDEDAERTLLLRITDPLLNTQEYREFTPGPSGIWRFGWPLVCRIPGTYVIRAIATNCVGGTDEDEASVLSDHLPTVSLVVKKDTDGSDKAFVTYNFPQTKDAVDRTLRLQWASGEWMTGNYHPPLGSGTWTVDLNACSPKNHADAFRAVAEACFDTARDESDFVKYPKCEDCTGSAASGAAGKGGRPPKACCFGDPIHAASGNMRVTDSDPLPGEIAAPLVRTYDHNVTTTGSFGIGWTSLFDATLRASGSSGRDLVSIRTETAERYLFELRAGRYQQTWPKGRDSGGSLTFDNSTSSFIHREGSAAVVRVFHPSADPGWYRLTRMRPVSGSFEVSIEWSGSLPAAVTDSRGQWRWTITHASGRIATISVENRPDLVWTYTYSSGKLQRVSVGTTTWRTYTYDAAGLTEARDGAGKLLESHTYASGRAVTSTGPSGDITAIAYDIPSDRNPDERVTRVTWASGRTTDYFVRPAGGEMRTVEVAGSCNCGGDDSVFGYDADGQLVREQNSRGYVTARTWADGRVVRVETALRRVDCDPANNPSCKLTPDTILTADLQPTEATQVTTYSYDDLNWPDFQTAISTVSIAQPGGSRVERFTYDASTGQTLAESVTGWTAGGEHDPGVMFEQISATTYTYYDGSAVAVFDPGGTFVPSWLLLPQPRGMPRSIDGPRTDVTDVTQFVYFPIDPSVPAVFRGRVAATRNALGHITRYESYDVFGPARVVDANGVAVETTWDRFGRPVMSTTRGVANCDLGADPLCATDLITARAYDGAGPLTSVSSPGGGATAYEYDDRGRLRFLSRGPSLGDLRERIETTYHPQHGKKQLESYQERVGSTWTERRRESYTYDSFSRVSKIVHADGTFVEYSYDAAGNLVAVRDENHTAPNTTYVHDPADRLVRVIQQWDTSTIETTYAYDGHGNLSHVVDPNGNATQYQFDDFGRILGQESAVSGITTYRYDAAGNLVSTRDANLAATTWTYDVLNRPLRALSTGNSPDEKLEWAWDDAHEAFGIGRLASMADPSGLTSYAYERRGLLRRESRDIGGGIYTTQFSYDADGNRAGMTYPSSDRSTYVHDFAGRPVTLEHDGVPIVTGASYLPFGPMRTLLFGNGTTRSTTYDARYRVDEHRLSAPHGVVARYDYFFDPAGNVTAIDDLLEPGYSRTFRYDDVHRLINANGGAALWGTGAYTYDAMGNLLSAVLGSWRYTTFTLQGTTPKIAWTIENGQRAASPMTPLATRIPSAGRLSAIRRATTSSPRRTAVTSTTAAASGRSRSRFRSGRTSIRSTRRSST